MLCFELLCFVFCIVVLLAHFLKKKTVIRHCQISELFWKGLIYMNQPNKKIPVNCDLNGKRL